MKTDLHLVDSSVWLEVLPPGGSASSLRARIDSLLAADAVATTGMVRLELLGGARTEAEYRRLTELLSALHFLPLPEEGWDEAAHLGFELRRRGITVPFTDLLIAAVALRGGVVLLHRDHHFDLIASHLPLKVESHLATENR